jgi:TctA family transporter
LNNIHTTHYLSADLKFEISDVIFKAEKSTKPISLAKMFIAPQYCSLVITFIAPQYCSWAFMFIAPQYFFLPLILLL